MIDMLGNLTLDLRSLTIFSFRRISSFSFILAASFSELSSIVLGNYALQICFVIFNLENVKRFEKFNVKQLLL